MNPLVRALYLGGTVWYRVGFRRELPERLTMSYESDLIDQGLCPDLVWIPTEDGPVTGRCMGPIVSVTVPADPRYGDMGPETVAFACEGHTAERLSWRAMSEQERYEYEYRQEMGW